MFIKVFLYSRSYSFSYCDSIFESLFSNCCWIWAIFYSYFWIYSVDRSFDFLEMGFSWEFDRWIWRLEHLFLYFVNLAIIVYCSVIFCWYCWYNGSFCSVFYWFLMSWFIIFCSKSILFSSFFCYLQKNSSFFIFSFLYIIYMCVFI